TWASVIIGAVAGIMVFYSVRFFEKRRIDDPIFALSVHGIAGVWGTLSTGIFATSELAVVGQAGLLYGGGLEQLGVQAMGITVSAGYAFVVSFLLLLGMKAVMKGLRVTEEQELAGLDISEHGSYGYPEAFNRDDSTSVLPRHLLNTQ